jgi:NAD-dependent SIR2 family protein deacetylase
MTSRRRAPRPVRCKRCHRAFPRNTEAGRHVRDGGYCVQCEAETTPGVRSFQEPPPKPFDSPPVDNRSKLGADELERLGEIIAEIVVPVSKH